MSIEKKKFKVISPIDQSVLLERTYATSPVIQSTLVKSKEARAHWKKTSIQERAGICKKAVDYLVSKADEIGREITVQMGRPISYTPNEIKGGLQERADYMIAVAESSLANIDIDPKRYITREPLGTVLVLAPWNYPFLTSINAIVPALMAGNTVILKHSEQTPLTAERYQEAFDEAGLPAGVFQYLHIDHEQTAHLIKDENIDFVAFTGSVEGGKAVQQAMVGRFIGSGFELGGKDAAYVRPDASIPHAAESLVDGAFFNSGQSCCGIERIYVHEAIFEAFLERFVSLTQEYKMGDPLDPHTQIGPMVRLDNAQRVSAEISKAVRQGARTCINKQSENHGAFVYPEVLINVDHSMSIMRDETFGPVVGIMPAKDDQEAVHLINDSTYGLTSSIWTSDLLKAKEIGDQLQVGTVFMNRCDYLDPALAWTGVKNSGRGCTLSTIGYDAFTRPKSFHLRTL